MANISSGAIKVVEVIGISKKSFNDAVAQAVRKASQSIKGITGVEVVKHSAKVEGENLFSTKQSVNWLFRLSS